MELKSIEQLVEKYLEAETSLQEEAQLKAYFSSEDVAPHLKEYAPMFTYFSVAKEENYTGEMFQQVRYDNEVLPGKPPVISLAGARRKVYSWVAVAASIVLMAGIFLQENPQTSEFGSYEDPEVAMEETKKALQMVSLLMNSGNDNLGHLNEFNNTKDKLLK